MTITSTSATPAPIFPDRDALAAVCGTHGIRRLSLFGSTLQGTARLDSDVDLLVEFEPGRVPGYLGMSRIQYELSELLGGQTVDLRTPAELGRHFRERVLDEARVEYAAA